MKNIYLIGFMASGKSTTGKILAEKLNKDFVDLDNEIIARTGKSIPEIFEKYGEETFRKYESEVLNVIAKKTDLVVATGGGTPCFDDNMDIINKSGKSYFLDLSVKNTYQRLTEKIVENRPLLTELEKQNFYAGLKSLYDARKGFYLKANTTVNCDNKSLEDICTEILGE